MHVLAPELAGSMQGLPELPETVRLHRSFAGPLSGAVASIAGRRNAEPTDAPPSGTVAAGTLNWKGWLFTGISRAIGWTLFPDMRAEWYPWARRRLTRLLDSLKPDAVISSHEPATTLSLGLLARRRRIPWIADLGDPVLVPYTPRHWARRAFRLERLVCASADAVIVTTDAARELLLSRHGADASKISVITQGFDDRRTQDIEATPGDAKTLDLFFSGRLYRFRRPDALLAALIAVPGIRLTVACPVDTETLALHALQAPERIRVLGALPHRQVLALQRAADVLVDIGNEGPSQVPGKIYEYLGACRPILHLDSSGGGEVAGLLRTFRRGWTCRNRRQAIEQCLAMLRREAAAGRLEAGLDLSPDRVAAYGWSRLAIRLEASIQTAMAPAGAADPAA